MKISREVTELCPMSTEGRKKERTDRQTDRSDRANSRFSQLCERD